MSTIHPIWKRTLGLIIVPLMLLGPSCTKKPKIYGGYIPNPPSGFIFDLNATQGRNVFKNGDIIYQRAYSNLSEDNHCSIYITKYDGTVTMYEIQDARDYLAKRYDYLDYSPLEELAIGGRPAWGWLETQYYEGELSSLEYKAVVPYDDATYGIEFFAADPKYRDKGTLREMVSTFRIGEDKVDPIRSTLAVLVGFGFAALGLLYLSRKPAGENQRKAA
jgi:hypothetical protein